MSKSNLFTSRWGLAMTLIGASVGPGSIWRFPRMAAIYEGGAFIIAMIISFLLIGTPIIVAEMVMGRSTRHGAIGAFADYAGKKFAWMGAFLCITLVAIVGFYTVTMAWILEYAIMSLTGSYVGVDTVALYDSVASNNPITVLIFVVCLGATAFICNKGVGSGMEKINSFMIPALFIMLVVVAVRTLMLPDAIKGLDFLFSIKPGSLSNPEIWLQGMAQSAWTVGPGWGLVLTYAVYTKAKDDVALNEYVQGFGVTSAALLAGFAIFPAIFATYDPAEAQRIMATGSYGLTFIALANVFATIEYGLIIGFIFFIALFFGAFSSNIIMFQVCATSLVDMGISKTKAIAIVFGIVLLYGVPAAWNIDFFANQEWVTSMMLLLGSLFTCFAINRFGAEKMRTIFVNHEYNELYMGKWWTISVKYVCPVAFTLMFAVYAVGAFKVEDTWAWFSAAGLGTALYQIVIYCIFLVVFNNKMVGSIKNTYFNGSTYPEVPAEHSGE